MSESTPAPIDEKQLAKDVEKQKKIDEKRLKEEKKIEDKKLKDQQEKEKKDPLVSKIADLEKAGYIPNYSRKPLHVGLGRWFDKGFVVLAWLDLPIQAERAHYKGQKEYVIDPRSTLFHDHPHQKSFLLYDMDKNLPLMGTFQSQPNSKSADLQAIYGVKESFRQFVAGIRAEVNRNVRQTVVMAIIFMVTGLILGHFL